MSPAHQPPSTPILGMGQGVGHFHPQLTTRELQGLVIAQSLSVVPLPEASRQRAQWRKYPSPSPGQTLLEEFEGNVEHGHLTAAAEDGCQQPSQHVQGDLSPTPDQEAPKKAELGQSMWCCRTWPAKQLCPVPQAARAHPSGHHSRPPMGGRAMDRQHSQASQARNCPA